MNRLRSILQPEAGNTILFCFSPAVMLTTFIVESALAIATFARYKLTEFGQVASLTIVCLATFQAAEYQICTGSPAHIQLWTRIGMVAITMLPPLGLHLAALIMGKSRVFTLSYGLAALFVAIFIFAPTATDGAACLGNYVVLYTHNGLDYLYGAYYFFFLAVFLWGAGHRLRSAGKGLKKANRSLIIWLIIGYLSFILPMAAAYAIIPQLAGGAVPSIMCGFAVFLSLIIALRLAPFYHRSLKPKPRTSKGLLAVYFPFLKRYTKRVS